MIRAAIYARLSSADSGSDTSDSIQNQVAALTKLASREGHDVVATFTDDGLSGFKGIERPGFSKLLSGIAAGAFDLILVRHADRLSRNDGDSSLIRTACARYGVKWQTADGAITDPSTSSGAFSAKLFSALAEMESAIKSERLREHYAAAAAKGKLLPTSQTFGFGPGGIVVEHEAALIRQAYEHVASGLTVGSLVRKWNTEGVPQRRAGARWQYATVNSILRRPANAGLAAYKGELLSGVPILDMSIVDSDLWHQVQAIISNPARRTSPGFQPVHLTSGIAHCGQCGSLLRSNTYSGNGRRRALLRCPASTSSDRHGSADLTHLDGLVRAEIITAFLLGPANMFPDQPDDAAPLRQALAALQRQREDVLDLLADQTLTKAQARPRLQALNEQEQQLREQLEHAQVSTASFADIRAGLWAGATVDLAEAAEVRIQLGAAFDALHIEQRRALVRHLLHISVHRGAWSAPGKYSIQHTIVTSLNS